MKTKRSPRPSPIAHRQGLVLIVVTVLLLLISLATMGFVAVMQTEYKATRQRGDELILENTAASARQYLGALAEKSRADRAKLGGMLGNSEWFLDRRLRTDEEIELESPRFAIVSGNWANKDAAWRAGPTNESAKLHLQQLLEWDREQPGSAQQALLKIPGMTPEVADGILDWVDADSQPRAAGSESSGGRSGRLPRNALPPVIDELLGVAGVTREALIRGSGNEANAISPGTRRSPGSRRLSLSADTRLPPWREFLTVHSAERNVDYDGRPRIQLNQPDLVQLQQQLLERLDPNWARYIIAYRQFGPYSARGGTPAEGFEPDLSRPGRFKIASELDLVGSRVAVAGSGRSAKILSSPLAENRIGWAGQLTRVLDQITADLRPVIPGRVNIDVAPREVLAAIPGIDLAAVDRILAARTLSADGRHEHAHPGWILEQGIVDLAGMKRLLPKITTGGDVWSGQVVAYFADRASQVRGEFVIDAATQGRGELYWKDLRDEPRLELPGETATEMGDSAGRSNGRTGGAGGRGGGGNSAAERSTSRVPARAGRE